MKDNTFLGCYIGKNDNFWIFKINFDENNKNFVVEKTTEIEETQECDQLEFLNPEIIIYRDISQGIYIDKYKLK